MHALNGSKKNAPQSRGMSSMLRRLAVRRVASVLAAGVVMTAGHTAFAASASFSATPADANWANGANWSTGNAPGTAAGGYTNATVNTDVATFAVPLSGTIGTAANPIVVDLNRFLKSITFDTGAGAFVIGSTGGNLLQLYNAGAIQVNAGVTNAQVINNPIQVRQASSTNATYSFLNNSTTSSATLTFGAAAFTLTAANGRPTTLTLGGTNTGANTISSNITDASATQGVGIITKTGAGTWILSGTNVFTGTGATALANGIQVNGGTLTAANNAALGTNATANTNQVSINNTGTLQIANGITLDNGLLLNLFTGGTVQGAGTSTVNSGIKVDTSATSATLSTVSSTDLFTIGNAANDLTGGVSTTVLNISGPGTVLLSQASNYAGSFSLNAGTTRLGNATALGAATTASVAFGSGSTGKLQLNGNSVTLTSLTTNATPGSAVVENGTAGTSTLTVNNASANTFAGVLQDGAAGTLSLAKTGAGSLTLSGANTYTGGTTIGGGAVFSNSTAATGAGPVAVNSGGTLAGTGAVSGSVTVASGGHIAPGPAGTAGSAAAVGTLPVNSLTLNGGSNLDYDIVNTGSLDQILVNTSGGLTINGGTLNINGGTGGFTANGIYNLIGYSGAIGGTGVSALSVNAANQNTATNTYSIGASGTYVTLTVASSGATPDYWNVDANGLWSVPANWTAGVPNAVGAFAAFGGGGTPITANRTVTVDGAYTVGTLAFNNPTFSYTLSPGTGALITLDNGASTAFISDTAGSHVIQSPLALTASGATVTVSQAADTLTASGIISGAGDILTKSGTGTLALTAANTYTGGTNLNLGTLQINSASSLGDVSGSLNFGGGTLALLADVTTTRAYVVAGTADALINTNAHNLTLNGTLTPASGATGGLTKSGAGTLTLAGVNTYTGATTITGGTLSISSNANLGDTATAAGVTLSGGTLAATATTALDNGTNFRPVTLGAGGGTIDAAATTTLTVGGTVTGATLLTKTGAGTLLLSGANAASFTGGTVLAGGTLALGGGTGNLNNALGSGGVTFQGGTLNSNGYLAIDNGTVSYDLNNALFVAGGQVGTINYAKRASLGSTLTGAGTLTLNLDGNRDLMNGNFSAFTGQLNLGVVTGIGASTGAEFRLNNGNGFVNAKLFLGAGVTMHQLFNPPSTGNLTTVQNIGELSGDAGSFLGGNPVSGRFVNYSVGSLNTNSTFAGIISAFDAGAAAITKVGTGTLTLTGTNTYTGSTTISAGTLQIGNGGTIGTLGTGAVTDNGTLAFNHSDTITPANAINGTGALQQSGSGTLTLTSASSLGNLFGRNGTILIDSGGSVTTSGFSSIGFGAGDVAVLTVQGTGSFSGANDLNIGDNPGTTGTLNLTGGTVSAVSVYVGSAFNAIATSPSTSGTVNQSGGTLTVTGANGLSLATRFNATGVYNLGNGTAGSGTLTVQKVSQGTGTSGTLNFNGGTLQASASNASFLTGLTSAVVEAGGAVIDTQANSVTVGQSLTSGAVTDGGLTKKGSGVLTLTGANNYNGGTTVSAGTITAPTAGYSTGTVTVSPGATADYTQGTANSAYAASIVGGGSVTVGGQGANTGTITYSGQDSAGTVDNTNPNAPIVSGGTFVNAGTLLLNRSGGSALTGPAALATGGTLALGSDNQIQQSNTSIVNMSGGTLAANGHSEGTPTTSALGRLVLTGSQSTLDFGDLSGNSAVTLAFADSGSLSWTGTVQVTNYASGIDMFYIGTSKTLTADQLSRITFSGVTAIQLDSGQVVAPEPSGWVSMLSGAGLLGGIIARKRRTMQDKKTQAV